jgi:hypothetical protein
MVVSTEHPLDRLLAAAEGDKPAAHRVASGLTTAPQTSVRPSRVAAAAETSPDGRQAVDSIYSEATTVRPDDRPREDVVPMISLGDKPAELRAADAPTTVRFQRLVEHYSDDTRAALFLSGLRSD